MAQQDLPGKIAQDVEGFIPAPVRKLWGKYSGAVDKVTQKGSSTNVGKLPDAWEEANRKSIQQQLGTVGKVPPKKQAVKKGVQKKAAVKRKVTR